MISIVGFYLRSVSQPYFVRELVAYFTTKDKTAELKTTTAYIYAASIAFISLVHSVVAHWLDDGFLKTGMMVRVALGAAAYRKVTLFQVLVGVIFTISLLLFFLASSFAGYRTSIGT